MNKRQKKKFDKKLNNKTYYNYRRCKLALALKSYTTGENDILYIVDSKRMDLKHIKEISVLKNVTILQPKLNKDDNSGEFAIEFSCFNTSCNDAVDNAVDEWFNNYKNWFENISREGR